MRRLVTSWIVVSLIGFVVGMGYRYVWDHPSEASVANYLRSALHGMGLAAGGWGTHLYLSARGSDWLRRRALIVEVALRAIAIAIVVSILVLVLEVALYGHWVDAAWFATTVPRAVAISLVVSLFFGALFELTRLIGGRVLVNVALGRYRHPRREERVVMFLDLAGSTALAEALGEVRMQELLTRFFFDIDAPIVAHGGEVHAYVGDEVIVTWPLAAPVAAGRCLYCFFAIADRIAASAPSYQREFGSAPRFRAALHAGPVVIGECGDSRRQIAYFGDTLNVTARLQEQCKETGRALLVSGDLLRSVRPGPELRVAALGPTQLRGRAAPVEVFAVERAIEHAPGRSTEARTQS